MSDDAVHGRREGTRAGVGTLGRVLAVRLGPGEDLLPAMTQLLRDAGFEQGIILSGVASLHHLTVRNIDRFPPTWPITTSDRTVTTIPGPLEILAMQGNVCPGPDGRLVIHCHLDVSVGAPAATTFGGHLVDDTIVATTCELFVAELSGLRMQRVLDDHTRAAEITLGPSAG